MVALFLYSFMSQEQPALTIICFGFGTPRFRFLRHGETPVSPTPFTALAHEVSQERESATSSSSPSLIRLAAHSSRFCLLAKHRCGFRFPTESARALSSLTHFMSQERESNPRPLPYHGSALPTELSWLISKQSLHSI